MKDTQTPVKTQRQKNPIVGASVTRMGLHLKALGDKFGNKYLVVSVQHSCEKHQLNNRIAELESMI